jgi:uncharacterized protein (TIGR02757 family)
MMTKAERFRPFFESLYEKYNTPEYVGTDPIVYPYTVKGNTEFVAFCSSCFAYGNVKAIQGFLMSFFSEFGTDPFTLENKETRLYYRFQKPADVRAFVLALKELYTEHGSIENAFSSMGGSLEESLISFVIHMKKRGAAYGGRDGYSFLFADPVKSGAKRLRMFLRWMVRKDQVDFGIWKNYACKDLHFIIDTHILRFAYKNGIIRNDSGTRKNLDTVTDFFREMNPDDPAKYDFAVSRLGIAFGCTYGADERCVSCAERDMCPFNEVSG